MKKQIKIAIHNFFYVPRLFVADIHIRALREKVRAYEVFTGLPNWKLKQLGAIIHYTAEIEQLRAQNIDLMNANNALRLERETKGAACGAPPPSNLTGANS